MVMQINCLIKEFQIKFGLPFELKDFGIQMKFFNARNSFKLELLIDTSAHRTLNFKY